ncbi:kelch-like protein 10 [Haemaphysalis longicornis]
MTNDAPTSLAALRTSDGVSIAVFKDKLSECSRYFDALFNGPLSEACQGDFAIPGVSRANLQAIATYANTGEVAITVDNVEELAIAADQLLVDGLLSECCTFMSHHVDAENCVMVLETASLFHWTSLHKPVFRFLLDNFELVYAEDHDFSRLSPENFESLLASDELKVRREEVVWEATVSWIKADPAERGQCLDKFLPHIRFCLMKNRYLKKVVMRDAFVYKNPFCKTMVKRCYKIKQAGRDACSVDSARDMFVHRVPAEVMFVYGGIHRGYKSNTWEVYDHKTNEWGTVHTDFRQDLVFGLQCVSVGHKIYVMGADIGNLCPFCYCFDAAAIKWSSIKPMSQLRAFFGIAVLDSCVYCIGGSPNGVITLDTAEEYDSGTDTWRTVGRMNYPRLGAGAASCAGRVYIVGGMSTETLLRSVEAYDPATDEWTVVAPMKTARLFHGLVTYRDKIYVIGGLSSKANACEVYDPKSGKWSKSAKTKTFTDKVVAVVLDDKIYAIGEENQKDYRRRLEYFAGRKWHAIPGHAPPRWFYSACVVKNLPNTMDYITRTRGEGGKVTL